MIFKRKKENIIIIGNGETGKAIYRLYGKRRYNVTVIDIDSPLMNVDNIDVMNICIPYSENFIHIVQEYIKQYKPKLTIIHSTVLPGTTKQISTRGIIYSPVIGIHPELLKSIKTFKKFIGADNKRSLSLAKKHFKNIKVKFKILKNTKTVETAKILSTLYYGMCIAFHDDVDKLCKETKIPFNDVMLKWNTEYNRGYNLLGKHNVIRPVLSPPKGKIGGHCIIPNAEIIKDYFKSDIIKYILKLK